MREVMLVVPCYNEERRLDVDRFLALSRDVHLLFVNDGSRDKTGDILRELSRRAGGAIEVLDLEANAGKAEAVRRGMLRAIDAGATTVGYADSDLATPPDELLRLMRELSQSSAAVVIGSRVALAGSHVERKATRHYMGRVFATAASLVLGARFYDTQCGAKVFKVTPLLRAALQVPFASRWVFDVELLGRLLDGGLAVDAFVEVPLKTWRDVEGSKLNSRAMARAVLDLVTIARRKKK